MKHFSAYLLDQNLLTASQLQEGIASQSINSRFIGYQALKKGYISDGILRKIVRLNGSSGTGETVQRCDIDGFLTENQLFELLRYQAFNHNYLGLSLINLGYMTTHQLKTHLRRFKHFIFDNNTTVNLNETGMLATELILEQAMIHHRKFLFDTGYATELLSVSQGLDTDDSKINFATSLKLNRKTTFYVGVSLEKETLFNIAQFIGQQYADLPKAHELHEIFGQILFNLNYSLCRNLRKDGLKLKHGPVQYHFPDFSHCTTTRCRLLNEYMDISVMH